MMEVESIVNRMLEILKQFDMPKADAMDLFKEAEKSFKEVVAKSRSDVKPPNDEERAEDVKLLLNARLKESESEKERLEDAISKKKEKLEVIEKNLKSCWLPSLNKKAIQLETEKAEVSKEVEELQARSYLCPSKGNVFSRRTASHCFWPEIQATQHRYL